MPAPIRVSALPPAVSVSGSEVMPAVQGGGTVRITLGQIANFASLQSESQVSILTAQAVSAANAATSAATQAAAAAVAARGIYVLTSVSSTLNGDGRATAYTATAPVTAEPGAVFLFTPNANNAAAPSLSVNGATARTIRAYDDTVLSNDSFRAGAQYILTYGPNNRYLAQTNDTIYAATGLFTRTSGTFNFSFFTGDEAQPRGMLQAFADGTYRFRTGGDGVNFPATGIVDIGSTGNVRTLTGEFRDRSNAALYSPTNPPPLDTNYQDYVNPFPGRRGEDTGRGQFINQVTPYTFSGGDNEEWITVNTSGSWGDMRGVQPETRFTIETNVSGTIVLWSGEGGRLFRSITVSASTTYLTSVSQVGISPDTIAEVFAGRDSLRIIAHAGTLSLPSLSIPTYGRSILWLGQSWAVRSSRNALYGMQRTYQALGLNRSIWSIVDAAFGASSLLKGGATVSTNYHWDHILGVPGPNATAARDVALASSDPPDAAVLIIGANDYPILAPNVSGVTPTEYGQYLSDYWDWMQTGLSLPNLPLFVCPMGGQRASGIIAESACYGQRYGQLHAVTRNAHIFRGADWYDIYRPDGIHPDWAGQALHGTLLTHYIANNLEARTDFTQPKITGFSRVSPNLYQFTIDRNGSGFFQRPTAPIGFAVLPDGDLFGTPLTITNYAWNGDNLRVTTATDNVSAIGAYPYGSFSEGTNASRLVSGYSSISERQVPLATYYPDPTV